MLNKVMLIGRLGRDPELRYTQNGTPVTSLSIATDESYTDRDGNRQERTEWHRVTVFQKQAELCSNYLSKGSLVYVEGTLQTRKWQDQQGQDRYTTEIRAQRVQFLDRRNAGDGMQRGGDDYQQGGRGGWNNNQQHGGFQQAPQSGYQQHGGFRQAPQGDYQQHAGFQQTSQDGYQDGGYQHQQQGGYGAPSQQASRYRNETGPADMEARDRDLGGPAPSESDLDEVPF